MPFLEDLGRTQSLPQASAMIGGTALSIRQQAIQDRSLQMQGAEFQQQSAINAQTLQKMQNENDMAAEKKAQRAKSMNIRTDIRFQAFSKAGQDKVFEHFYGKGLIDKEGVGPSGPIGDEVQAIETDKNKLKEFALPEVQDKENVVIDLHKKFLEARRKPGAKPEALQKMQDELTIAQEEARIARQNYTGAIDKLSAEPPDKLTEHRYQDDAGKYGSKGGQRRGMVSGKTGQVVSDLGALTEKEIYGAKGRPSGNNVPDHVAKAQALVLKMMKDSQIDPNVAFMYSQSPDMNIDSIRPKITKTQQEMFDYASGIVRDFYKSKQDPSEYKAPQDANASSDGYEDSGEIDSHGNTIYVNAAGEKFVLEQ